VPFGATDLLLSTGSVKAKTPAATTTDMSGTMIGVSHALSKRTTAYFRAETIDDKAGLVAARATIDVAGQTKITKTALGVRHTF
jgi:predicted porin